VARSLEMCCIFQKICTFSLDQVRIYWSGKYQCLGWFCCK